ncbi:MAG: tetratricopeptide repeat protein [Acidobacteriia bacterium]|nr:tetratricopeptide repeat protein [Terriglobia bacterium]
MVFVSHSGKDDEVVAELRLALEGLKIEAWTDSQRLAGGDKLKPAIRKAIEEASHFVAILGLHAINSAWVFKEIKYALKRRKKVIPVLLPGIEPSALHLWFGEEPVGVKLIVGPGGVSAAFPGLLAALGERLPEDGAPPVEAQLDPIAELVLELSDPAIDLSGGKRRATATALLTYHPPDGGRAVESQRFHFTAPLGPIEAGELAWYLERYINWPTGVFQDRARRVEESLPGWGRLLYDAVTASGTDDRFLSSVARLEAGHPERRFTIKVDKSLVAGSPEDKQKEADEAATLLLSLPWELIHDGKGFLFQGKRGVRVRRSLPNRNPQPAVATDPPIRVLLVSPRPEDAGYIDHRASARPLVEALSKLGDLAEFHILAPPTFQALEQELQRRPYHVVHFDGHGVYDPKEGLGALCFEDPADRKRTDLVTADKIAAVVRGHRVPLFFLDACQTAVAREDPTTSVAGKLLESGVASIVAMSHSVLVETARRFVAKFYEELMAGKRVGQAMLAGQQVLKSDTFRGKVFNLELRLEDWFVPVLFQEEQDAPLIRKLPSERIQALIAKQRELSYGAVPPEPAHGFLGRSRELLAAERILCEPAGGTGPSACQSYVVFQGDGGEGKTTLAAELARWLVLTRRFQRSAFVSLEFISDARAVLHAIGGQLLPNFEARAGQDPKLALQLVEHTLAEQGTAIMVDNVESVLPPPIGADADAIMTLCQTLAKIGQTRLIFTSREALPEPFSRNVVRIGRLDRPDAIRLVSGVCHSPSDVESEQEIEDLVDAVGCHARALVLLAGEVGASGVRGATDRIHELMASLEAKHPGERERSLFASVELSLHRLPAETRRKIRPLGVFQGGGSLGAIALALKLEQQPVVALGRDLIGVGLAEQLQFGYLRFDPALAPALLAGTNTEEREAARSAWAEAIEAMIGFLHQQLSKDAKLALNLALLELPNLLAMIEHIRKTAEAERVVELATHIEALIAPLGRARALARVVEIRSDAARRLGAWSHVQFDAERIAIDRSMDHGRIREATDLARSLLAKMNVAGDAVYEEAPYDIAGAHFTLGRALKLSGASEEAVEHLDEAHRRFQKLGAASMMNSVLGEKADCLTDLGRYDEAADLYEESIRSGEEAGEARSVAVRKGQLATLRQRQGKYPEALELYTEVRDIFRQLGEPSAVATVGHLIGMIHSKTGQYDAAEKAYQESLRIYIQVGSRVDEATTLGALGSLYSRMGRFEEAVLFQRQAAEVYDEVGDLRREGNVRNNSAIALIRLTRFEEAHQELSRAIECKKPFGHAAEPWTTFDILTDLERAVGNQPEAFKARAQAVQAYLDYRRDRGESRTTAARLCALLARDPDAARAKIAELHQRPDLPAWLTALIPPLEAILDGSRDPALADNPSLNYTDAVELLLLIESLR